MKTRLPIFKAKLYKGCSNGGISDRCDFVDAIFDDQTITVSNDYTVKLVKRILWGEKAYYFEPVEPVKDGNVGYMMGGAYIKVPYEFQKEFGAELIPLFDRQETAEEYEMSSR